MESLPFDPNASHRNDVGDVVRTWAPVQTNHGVYASTDNGAGHHQRQNAARLEGSLHIVFLDNREFIISSSDLKYVSGLSGAVFWMNPMLPKPGAQRMATYPPTAGSSCLGQNMANARSHGDYTALVSTPNPAIDDVDIDRSGGHVKNDWPSQSNYTRPAHSNLHGSSSSLQDRASAVPPINVSSSWNNLRPNLTVQPFSTDQYLNGTCDISLGSSVGIHC